MDAKYIAYSAVFQETIWLQKFLKRIEIEADIQIW